MIDFKMKNFFFDRAIVQNAMDKATLGALSKGGAWIMRAARTSMRWRSGLNKKGEARFGKGRKPKPASPPGTPPFAWREQGQMRSMLFFAFDPSKKTVVIGPQKFGRNEAPNLNEFGGRAVRQGRRGVKRTVTYPPRPFMKPALDREAPKLPSRWANAVKS